MRRRRIAIVVLMFMSGCAAWRHDAPQWSDAQPAAYWRQLRTMTPEELRAESARVAGGGDPAQRLRQAMLLAVAQNPVRDDVRAQAIAESVERSDASPTIRAAAGMFGLWLAEAHKQDRRTRDDQKHIEQLEARLRDAERRASEAERKLDALKQIEREMNDRSGASVPTRP